MQLLYALLEAGGIIAAGVFILFEAGDGLLVVGYGLGFVAQRVVGVGQGEDNGVVFAGREAGGGLITGECALVIEGFPLNRGELEVYFPFMGGGVGFGKVVLVGSGGFGEFLVVLEGLAPTQGGLVGLVVGSFLVGNEHPGTNGAYYNEGATNNE